MFKIAYEVGPGKSPVSALGFYEERVCSFHLWIVDVSERERYSFIAVKGQTGLKVL